MRRPKESLSPNLDSAISYALRDLRIVREMQVTVNYFKEQIDFASKNNIGDFVIDYDERGLFSNLVKLIAEKYKQSEEYRYSDYYDIEYVYQGDDISKSRKRKATPYIAAYIIKRFLPDNIEISRIYSQYEDNEFYFGVEITIN